MCCSIESLCRSAKSSVEHASRQKVIQCINLKSARWSIDTVPTRTTSKGKLIAHTMATTCRKRHAAKRVPVVNNGFYLKAIKWLIFECAIQHRNVKCCGLCLLRGNDKMVLHLESPNEINKIGYTLIFIYTLSYVIIDVHVCPCKLPEHLMTSCTSLRLPGGFP